MTRRQLLCHVWMCTRARTAEGSMDACVRAPAQESAVVGLCRLRFECALQMAVIMIR